MTDHKFHIGDLVKPNEKAYARNKCFTQDRRFVVTKVDAHTIWEDDEPVWYDLAANSDDAALYCLQEDEIELVRKFEWIF